MLTSKLEMTSARMITPNFSIVATKILKKSDTIYYAEGAEFTTCRDCTESWIVSGKKLDIEIGEYVQIYHALVKVKGVDVLYLPYIALPIKNERESGVLFPRISNKDDEGFTLEQPFYWAINQSQDATFTPTFLSERGYGLDLEYRQTLSSMSWYEFSSKMLMDTIYYPEMKNTERSGEKYFRHFTEFENHGHWSDNMYHHLRVVGSKDNDFLQDFSLYTEDFVRSNDLGVDFFLERHFENFDMGVETVYKNNLITNQAVGFDDSYVQILPKIYFNTKPLNILELDSDYLYKLTFGLSSDYTVFKQNRLQESSFRRNVGRLDASPYLEWQLFSLGPFQLKTTYGVDYQSYKFMAENQEKFYKESGLVSTELNFTIDRIFGLAYEEQYSANEIKEQDLEKISTKANLGKNVLSDAIIGKLPAIDNNLKNENIIVKKNSFRHSQEFKFIHHQLVHGSEEGNDAFNEQIATEEGWFDYRDAITEDTLELDSDEARKQIPLKNTLELQWNNVLIRKSPNKFDFFVDNKYLKDNFTYTKLGYFNVSQGYFLGTSKGDDVEDKLTRLLVEGAYSTKTWNFSFNDYYFHNGGDYILTMNGQKRFDLVNFLAQYHYNSFPDSSLKTIKSGFQFRPIDVLGFAVLQEYDLDADENLSFIYQLDFMPLNNCWIINLNYRETQDEKRSAVNFVFNFGNNDFDTYRTNFFNFNRLSQ